VKIITSNSLTAYFFRDAVQTHLKCTYTFLHVTTVKFKAVAQYKSRLFGRLFGAENVNKAYTDSPPFLSYDVSTLGPTALLPLKRKACCEFLSPLKSVTLGRV
jgi:hypothetical protein